MAYTEQPGDLGISILKFNADGSCYDDVKYYRLQGDAYIQVGTNVYDEYYASGFQGIINNAHASLDDCAYVYTQSS